MKFSRQRELIYNQVRSYPIHPTADQVYTALKADNPALSLGTVYRNLNQLSEAGMLLKIPIADGSDRFDARTDDHCHMVCDKCLQVFDIEFHAHDIVNKALEQHGHCLTSVSLTIRGVCSGCAQQNSSTEVM